MIRQHYSTTDGSRLHWRESGEGSPLLLCLHPAPHSGLYFETVMPLISTNRRVVAPDYPGYGGSSPVANEPTIADYARTMLALLEELSPEGPAAVLGFHTGCLVAAEMAVLAPSLCERLVLIDIPYFTGDKQRDMLNVAARPLDLGPGSEGVATLWDKNVAQRIDAMPLDRAVSLLAEQLRVAGRSHFAFRAAFTYACEQRMSAVRVPTHIIATHSGLLESTRECAHQMKHASLEERLDIRRAVFEEGAAEIALSINSALSGGTDVE